MTALPLEALVDPVCGIVRKVKPVEHPAGAPPRYGAHGRGVRRPQTRPVARRPGLPRHHLRRPRAGARRRDSRGMERYCGNRVPPPGHPDAPLRATAAELADKGPRLYGPADLPAYAPWQYARAKFPYRPLTADTPALWTRGTERLPDGTAAEVWAPVSLTHLNWRQGDLRELPRTHHLNYAGIATGQGLDDAVERGLLEVVERDALELWWHLDGPARGIDPASVPGLADDLAGSALDVHIVEMHSEFAPCMAALVHDPRLGLYAAGFACKYDPAEAARKAVLEAVHTWVFTQGLTDPDGWVFQAVEAGLLARGCTWITGPTAATSTCAASSSSTCGTWEHTCRCGWTSGWRSRPGGSPGPRSGRYPSQRSSRAAGNGWRAPCAGAVTVS